MKKHVEHYCHGGEETIDKIKRELTYEEYIGFCKGNIIKYEDRARYKGDYEGDMEKRDTYIDYMLNEMLEHTLELMGEHSDEDGTDSECDAVLGFTYPPLKDAPTIKEQVLKVSEEFDEMVEALVAWELMIAMVNKLGEKVDDEEYYTEAELFDAEKAVDFLIECEDVIHAVEELQRAVIRRVNDEADEEYQDKIKAEIQLMVFDKNDERGYYDLA